MGRAKRYDKEELLRILQKECPTAIAAFPSADTFKFQVTDNATYLRVGQALTEEKRVAGDAWVLIVGACKPWLHVRQISYGQVLRTKYKFVRCDGPFGLVTKSINVYAWQDWMRALISFVFVYAGRKDEFADFDRGEGLQVLIKVLRAIEAHTEAQCGDKAIGAGASGDSEEISMATEESSTEPGGKPIATDEPSAAAVETNNENEDEVTAGKEALGEVTCGTVQKRALDTEDDVSIKAKKVCTG